MSIGYEDQVPELPRVKFGKGPTQHIPHEWAEAILTALAESRPQVFGSLLKDAALGKNGNAK